VSRDNPLLELWRMADDQWAREWVAARERYERWTLETAKMILEEAHEKTRFFLEASARAPSSPPPASSFPENWRDFGGT
jgi:hypothetical protein